jgi:hypothetical protein
MTRREHDQVAIGDVVQRVGTTFTYGAEPIGIVVEICPVEGRWPDLRVATKYGVMQLHRWRKITRE